MCHTGNFNLSYNSLISYKARQKLCDLKTTDPEFWAELTQRTRPVLEFPGETIVEDDEMTEPLFEDDSDLPCEMIVASVLGSSPAGVVSTSNGDMISTATAELIDNTEMEMPNHDCDAGVGVGDLGCGKQKRTNNKLYDSFWRHNNNDGSDQESLKLSMYLTSVRICYHVLKLF